MSWPDLPAPRLIRLMAALSVAISATLALAGCGGGFHPLYGDRVTAGGEPSIAAALRGVNVEPIDTPRGTRIDRLSIEVRNDLIFALTGGSGITSPTHKLIIKLSSTQRQIIVDIQSGRPDVQNYTLNAVYTLTDLSTGKIVVNSNTFAAVSYNIPGQQQRFAGDRGLRDAENRASQVLAENIRNRLASYFTAGT